MTKCTNNIRFDAAASVPAALPASSPIQDLPDETVAEVHQDKQLARMAEPNNPVLTRSYTEVRRSLPGAAVTGSAILTSILGTLGCTGRDDVAVAAIGLGWGLATVGVWGGILLGLNWLAGWHERRSVSHENMQKHIKRGNWQLIENALLDEGRIPPDIAGMQLAVLESRSKIPIFWQAHIYKAIAIANGDPQLSARAIECLLRSPISSETVFNMLRSILYVYEKKPHKFVGTHVAKAIIKFEMEHHRSIPDFMLARAVELTEDSKDIVYLFGILSTRIRLGISDTNIPLMWAIRSLLQKPIGFEMYQNELLPFLVDIDGVAMRAKN